MSCSAEFTRPDYLKFKLHVLTFVLPWVGCLICSVTYCQWGGSLAPCADFGMLRTAGESADSAAACMNRCTHEAAGYLHTRPSIINLLTP